MFKRIAKSAGLSAGLLLAAAAPAFAHLNPAEHGSFMAGFSHPLFGADHILAMVAVGIWAAMIGGRAMLVVPASFVITMSIGFALALSGVSLPFVEPAILASVVGLGLLVALAVKVPTPVSAAVVAVFALFHGFAHGTELGGAGAMTFGLGFMAGTALLHAAGVGLGIGLNRFGGMTLSRLLGAATALAGLAMMAG
ncbi:HupE/UreJ family protein [Martelella lutilitoris]|uniref:HupE/UreJ family protein n=1 Tax=Martelella lutilitoris TaxID=2583532 RepID=A0A5C4JVM8_9HYPH|nr:HupE/UreJ family protein [Martelella lutilitoris]TNB49304.1 HupE/UreJ family protein [Martelella lutilitoris]